MSRPKVGVVLTGWFGGRKTGAIAHFNENELIEAGIELLADIFDLDPKQLTRTLKSQGAGDQLGRSFGARSLFLRHARSEQGKVCIREAVRPPDLFSGEALYRGRDMGTVEAALASGLGDGAKNPDETIS